MSWLTSLALVASILAKTAAPVIAVLLYAAALASAVYILRDRGERGQRA